MNKHVSKLQIISTAALLIAGFLGGCAKPKGAVYEDPQGRFTMEVDPSWEAIEADDTYAHFSSAVPAMQVYLLVLDAQTVDEAYARAFEILGFDPGLLQGGGFATFDEWEAYTQTDTADLTHALAARIVEGQAYVLVIKADKPGVSPESPAITRALASFQITGSSDAQAAIETYADLEAMVRDRVDARAGSVSMALVHGGEVVYTYVYGVADPIDGLRADIQTIYRYGSMTKPVTATALMQLVEKGLVDLDAWPGEYVPEFPERWKVTVRQLLDHSACMTDDHLTVSGLIAGRGEAFHPLVEIFTDYVEGSLELACEPGTYSNYANIHYLVLARIIEGVSGEPFETYVVDHILTPLGMESTHFQLVEPEERYAKGQYPTAKIDELVALLNQVYGPDSSDFVMMRGESFSTVDDFRPLSAWGGLLGTPSDLTYFLQMFLNDGSYGDAQVLQADTVAAMEEMQLASDGLPLGFGLSWFVGESDLGKVFFHSGGGATIETVMRYYPGSDLGVVVMGSVNGVGAERIADALVNVWVHEK